MLSRPVAGLVWEEQGMHGVEGFWVLLLEVKKAVSSQWAGA